jgi:16S rRNA (guanine966-N2)-methyltransferase
LRVVAGTAGGRRLESPAGAHTRPTTERVREALFSAVGERVVDGAVLDLYAGTGAMAIEALSRGATRALLVEHDRLEAAVCRRNLEHTGFAGHASVVEAKVDTLLAREPPPEAPFALVCCDPPYDVPDEQVERVLVLLDVHGWLEAEALVAVERPVGGDLEAPSGWRHRFTRTYGDTLVHLFATGVANPAT